MKNKSKNDLGPLGVISGDNNVGSLACVAVLLPHPEGTEVLNSPSGGVGNVPLVGRMASASPVAPHP